MKKIVKKIISLSMCICMMMALTVGASAAGPATTWGSPENARHWHNANKGYMNAYKRTRAEVVAGTKVTAYVYQDDITQKFYTSSGKIKCAANTSLSIAEVYDDNYHDYAAYLMLTNYGNNSFSIQSYNNGYRIFTSDGQRVLAALGDMNTSVPLIFIDNLYTEIDDTVWVLH